MQVPVPSSRSPLSPNPWIDPPFDSGTVWLVGAGPGDPGLLTLHAARALVQADVVLHDALVSDDVLALAPHARLEPVGKRAGRRAEPQLRINQRLIRLARQGLRVVRLKGGDPLIFGRGAEEALALAAAGIHFRIVPGISAAQGAAASAGIPLTHRNLGRSVTFATGHDSTGNLADLDWEALARASDVLALYMAGQRIGAVAERLIAAGRDPADPVALVADASTAGQVVRETTLARAGTEVMPKGSPVLILVGPVVALRSMIAGSLRAEPPSRPPLPMPLLPEPSRARG